MALTESFLMLAKLGFLDVILPFILVFTLTFALFKQAKIFGRMSKRTSIIVALFTAFMFVGLFSFQNFMWMLFWMVLVFTAFLFYVLLIKTMGLETKVNGFVLGIVFAIFAFIGLYQFVDLDRFIRFVFNPFIITIILFFLMIWFIVYEKGDKKTKDEKKTDEMKEGKKESDGQKKGSKRIFRGIYPFPKNAGKRVHTPAHDDYPETKYAIDFLMEIGTPVLASKGGKVIKTKSDSDKWGPNTIHSNDANYVAISHGDGTFTEYIHLGKNKVVVKVGQSVKEGDIIGYSGMSGYMDDPHLHFSAYVIENGKGVSIPTEFIGYKENIGRSDDYRWREDKEIPDYDFEEVERIPGDEFEKEFHKKYPPSGREY